MTVSKREYEALLKKSNKLKERIEKNNEKIEKLIGENRKNKNEYYAINRCIRMGTEAREK